MNKAPKCDFIVTYEFDEVIAAFFFKKTDDPKVLQMLSKNSYNIDHLGNDTSKWLLMKLNDNDTFIFKRDVDGANWFEDIDDDADIFKTNFWEGYSAWKLEQEILIE